MNKDRIIISVCILIMAFMLYWSKFQMGKSYTEMFFMYSGAFAIPLVFHLIKKFMRKRNK